MAYHQTWLLVIIFGMLKILGAVVVLPRPPSSELQTYPQNSLRERGSGSPTSSPGHNSLNLVIVTSSELPKQIPAPTQPLTHSSTPQYHEVEQQVSGLPQFKLLWITRQIDTNGLSARHSNLNTPSTLATHKSVAQRTDLLPNMI